VCVRGTCIGVALSTGDCASADRAILACSRARSDLGRITTKIAMREIRLYIASYTHVFRTCSSVSPQRDAASFVLARSSHSLATVVIWCLSVSAFFGNKVIQNRNGDSRIIISERNDITYPFQFCINIGAFSETSCSC